MAKKNRKRAKEVEEIDGEEEPTGSTIAITRSFSRKLNMAAHGGKQYETADIFCSITVSGDSSDAAKLSKQADKFCQDEVQKTIDLFDDEAEEVEEAEVTPVKKVKKIDVGIKVEQDELEEIQEFINDLTMAKDASDLKAAAIKIKDASARFSDEQKQYLSAYYSKRKEAIS